VKRAQLNWLQQTLKISGPKINFEGIAFSMDIKKHINIPDYPMEKGTNNSFQHMSRRNFAKKAFSGGLLSTLGLLVVPGVARAWLDGNFKNRDDLGAAFKVLERTYSDTKPYPHKFNDALVKLLLRDLDFVVRKGVHEKFTEDYVQRLGVLVNRHLKMGVEKIGKDIFLWAMFERTSCSYQLYENITINKGERSVPCPFKPMLANIEKGLGTYKITWEDVCTKWCNPVWHGFIKGAGLTDLIKIKVEPGNICTVKVV
jgi:hypothetical protein